MTLASDLISEFVKATNDDAERGKESTCYGTAVIDNNKLYVQIDGSDRLTPASTTVNVEPGERVTLMIKNHSAVITGNISSRSARIDDVSQFEVMINDSSKVATNYLSFDGEGLQIGDKTTGIWRGFRTKITNDSFDILNSDGTLLASYGKELVELGKDSNDAIISLCADEGKIEFKMDPDTGEEYLQVVSDKLRLKSSEMSSLYSTYTDDTTRWEKSSVNVSPAKIHVYASECIDPTLYDMLEGWNITDVYINPDGIDIVTPDISIKSDSISIDTPGLIITQDGVTINTDGVLSVTDSHGSLYTVETGTSGIWEYKKWSNGGVELWGSYDISDMACTTTLGGMYRTAVISPNEFPFKIYNPNLVASYESDGYGSMLWATTTTTSTKPPSYYLVRPTSATIVNGKINFQVRGKWKQ